MKHAAFVTTGPGVVCKRYPAMPKKQAEALAARLQNLKSLVHVTVEGARAGVGFYVAYLPASPTAQEALHVQLQQTQVLRAQLELPGYDFQPTPDGGCWITTLPDKQGHRDTYWVGPDFRCGTQRGEHACLHYLTRMRQVGAYCKHGCAWMAMQGEYPTPMHCEVDGVRFLASPEKPPKLSSGNPWAAPAPAFAASVAVEETTCDEWGCEEDAAAAFDSLIRDQFGEAATLSPASGQSCPKLCPDLDFPV